MKKIILFALLILSTLSACCKTDNEMKMLFPDNGPWGLVIHTPFEKIDDIGVQWVRIGARWNFVESKEGEYDFTDPDKQVDYYLANGYKIMFVLGFEDMPACYMDRKTDHDLIIKRIGKFATAAAKHYKGKNFLWEISNEPEVFPMEGYMNNPVTYTEISRLCAKNIKKYDKTSKIAACSIAWMDKDFLSVCFENGLLIDGTIDCISFHGYHRANYLPESALKEDIQWMREQCAKYSPKKYVSVVDSERGFGILDNDPFQPRHKDNWRSFVTCQSAQAAYLARHYFEEIYNQIELSVWYKDFHGETSYSLYPHTKEYGLAPMGYVYKNMAFLFKENTMKLVNEQYKYNLDGDNSNILWTRSYLSKKQYNNTNDRLFITFWNPVESFDGKILDKRELKGDFYEETWRDVKDSDIVDVTVNVSVSNINKVKNVFVYDLLSKDFNEGYKKADFEIKDNKLIIKNVKCNAMPALVIIDLN